LAFVVLVALVKLVIGWVRGQYADGWLAGVVVLCAVAFLAARRDWP
jgi:hypothetical protein